MAFMIHRRPAYTVYTEEGNGSAMSHVAELPGCFAVGTSAPKAVQAVPAAITEFLQWLRRHREPLVPEAHVSRPNLADLFVADVVHTGAPTQAGSAAALFEFDKELWSDDKLERTLRWLSYSRAALLARVEGLSDEELRARQVAPGRSMRDTLLHVANAEYGYITRIIGVLDKAEGISETEPAGMRERLAVEREIFVRHARAVPSASRTAIILSPWASHPDEPWTLPKALRRALEHEREHLGELPYASTTSPS